MASTLGEGLCEAAPPTMGL